LPKYRDAAVKYAALYEQRFGKKATVNINPKAASKGPYLFI